MFNSIMWLLFESSPIKTVKRISDEIYYKNEGAKIKRRYDREYAKLKREMPVYKLPEDYSNLK